jgi:plastocyanin
MSQGNKYSYKFTVADAYSYHCAYHSSMKASIIVIP